MSLKLDPSIEKALQKIHEDRLVSILVENSANGLTSWLTGVDYKHTYMISPHVLQQINEWTQASASGDMSSADPEPDPSLLFKYRCDTFTIFNYGCQCGGI